MRIFLLITTLLFSVCSSIRAQSSVLANVKPFPEASLILTTGAMLTGFLQLYPDAELVSIKCANDSTYTIPARLVQGFAVKDPLINQLPTRDTYLSAERVFRAFPLATNDKPGLSGWGFYEQLSYGPGPVLLLRRENAQPYDIMIPHKPAVASDLTNPFPGPIATGYTGFVYKTTLYMRTATGAMVRLRKPQHLLKYLPSQARLLRAYVRENELHYANLRDLSFLVNYANTLLKPTP